MSKILFVLCDSITNSVFSNLVLTPLHAILTRTKTAHVTLISFERPCKSADEIRKHVPPHPRFACIQHPRFPFWGVSSLWYQIHLLKKYLETHAVDQIMCRGPLAGYLALHARRNTDTSITIQARGLAAEEYRLACGASTTRDLSFKTRYIYHRLNYLEHLVYGTTQSNVTIETVSTALKEYLCTTFSCTQPITIATNDLPTPLTPEGKKQWRETIRTKLNIPHDAYVYCYAGSARPWQCGEETIQYIAQQLTQFPDRYALILTTQPESFAPYLKQYNVDTHRVVLTRVPPQDTLHYLAAADEGIILRKPDVINWVSRPTKILEYQCAHLTITHNNTVGYASEIKNKQQTVDL